MKKQRPINLKLHTIRFPITAIASIMHRLSGVIMFAGVGIILWIFGLSTSSPEGFMKVAAIMDILIVKLIFLGVSSALTYHILGGIRHMLMDFGCLEETFLIGTITSSITFFLTFVIFVLLAGAVLC